MGANYYKRIQRIDSQRIVMVQTKDIICKKEEVKYRNIIRKYKND